MSIVHCGSRTLSTVAHEQLYAFVSKDTSFFAKKLLTYLYVAHEHCPLWLTNIVHCDSRTLSTVTHEHCPLWLTNIVHCGSRTLSTVAHEHCPLWLTNNFTHLYQKIHHFLLRNCLLTSIWALMFIHALTIL